MLLFSSQQPIGPQPYPVMYVVTNPVRGLLDRTKSEEHLQSSKESKAKQNKTKTTKGKYRRRALDRESLV